MQTVLVTGANGFVGRHLIRSLSLTWKVISFDGDVTSAAAWGSLPRTDAVIHLAAKTSARASERDPSETLDVNTEGTRQAIAFCQRHDAMLVFASTNVYGVPQFLPVDETHPLQPDNPYAHSKLLAEGIIERSGVPSYILRFANIYGPGQKDAFLIPLILAQLRLVRDGTQSAVHLRTPLPKRDFVFVEDAVDALVRAVATRPAGCIVLNIGTGTGTSIGQVVQHLQEICGPFTVEYSGHVEGVLEHAFNPAKARAVLGWSASTSLLDGLRATASASGLLRR